MFNQTWKKYLPVIHILLKRSTNEEQSLSMNHTDFERAAGGRKMKWSFPSLMLTNGRIENNGIKYPPLALELMAELQMHDDSAKLLQKKQIAFSMTNDFKLRITNLSVADAAGTAALPEMDDTIEAVAIGLPEPSIIPLLSEPVT